MSLIHGPLAPRAIETDYAGTRFRSRLEARWAVFFDLAGWPWAYEPIDLHGYIPDFVLPFAEPLLVEVKPAVTRDDLAPHRQKIEASGWTHEALLVGTMLWPSSAHTGLSAGLLAQRFDDGGWAWASDHLFRCGRCGHLSLYHDEQTFSCRVHGCYDGDGYLGDDAESLLTALWAEAGTRTRWVRHAAAIPRATVDARVITGWQQHPAWRLPNPEPAPEEPSPVAPCPCRECRGLPW